MARNMQHRSLVYWYLCAQENAKICMDLNRIFMADSTCEADKAYCEQPGSDFGLIPNTHIAGFRATQFGVVTIKGRRFLRVNCACNLREVGAPWAHHFSGTLCMPTWHNR